MDLPDDDFLQAELRELREILGAAEKAEYETERRGVGRRADDYDWRRWLVRHRVPLLSILSGLLMLVGGLGGRVLSNELTDKQQFREALTNTQKWLANVDSRLQSVEQALPQYGDDARRSLRLMEDMQREQYQFYKAAAEERGDWIAAKRLKRKLENLPPPETAQ